MDRAAPPRIVPWQDCDSSGNNCTNISGATSSSYTLASGDVGHTIRAVVTATNTGGSGPATSAQTAVIAQSFQSTSMLFGNQSLANYADNNPAGSAQAFSYAATASGTTTDIELYVNSGATATKLIVGLYSDASGTPGTLLTTGSLSAPQLGAWNDVSVSSATITQGTSYWIAVLGTGGVLNYLDSSSGTGASYVESATGLTSLPSTYSPGAKYTVSPASAYVNGVLSGGGGGTSAPSNTAPPVVSGTVQQGNTRLPRTGRGRAARRLTPISGRTAIARGITAPASAARPPAATRWSVGTSATPSELSSPPRTRAGPVQPPRRRPRP